MHFDITKITRPELAVAIATQRTLMQELEAIDKQSRRDGCKACVHYASSTSFCSHWNNPVPPAHVTAGCDQWSYDSIPF